MWGGTWQQLGCTQILNMRQDKNHTRKYLTAVLIAAFSVSGFGRGSHSRSDTNDLPRQIRTYLSRLEGFGYSGAALVAKNRKVLVESGYGLANKQAHTPFRSDTIFDIGSVSKQFTAAAILLLESDGKLLVLDPISKYLKTVPEEKAGITIHHLLTHTSGLPMDFGDDYEKVSREEIVRRAMASELRSQPGQHHAYSNAGYSLLAAIVELVSEQTFETFLRERLFRPAGMASTGYFFPKSIMSRLAHGYKDGEDWGIGVERAAASGGDFWNLIGNGGIHSTVGDMYKWIVALDQGRVLTKEARQKFFEPHVLVSANYLKSNFALYYAYGWYVWKRPRKTLIFHLGGNGVFNAAVRYHVDERSVVVYASNVSEFHDPNYPVPAIERILKGEVVHLPPRVLPLAQPQLAQYAGSYRSASGAVLKVEAKSPFLRVEGEGQEALSFITNDLWQKDASLEPLNGRTAEAVENSRTHKYEALLKAYGPEMTAELLAESEALFWQKRHDRHGDYVRTRILGTLPLRSRKFVSRTIAAIDFAHGTTYREYLWTPEGKIGDLGPIVAAPSSRYFPESASCFVKFDPAEAIVSSRICLEKNDTGGIIATIAHGERRVELKSF
jgi:CubicO group peptidase (beta-lactamase class C family)